ncbi:MAG: sigma 54-interacting transcriptional regulator [Bdellovibrionales bacterium]|nr:sigma 54-interacting transcriptional regulator [Bdellovibrionales bacterium]
MKTQIFRSYESLKNPQAFVSFLNGPAHEVFEIKEFLSIGRNESNQFIIPDLSVSSRHARIEWKNGFYVLTDLRSRNGTLINGSRILEAPLSHNDRIRIGNTELIFRTERDKRPVSLVLKSKNMNWNNKLSRLPEMSRSDQAILIGGPSGTGKELLAKMIHRHSSRRNESFVSINCSAMSETLAESELFGHIKGSFTDATHDRKGAFESARGGTLFLDEIGDLPLSLQPKLLRALDNQEIRPVGSDRSLVTDVRIVAATHHQLKEKVLLGEFRRDLYFRLNILSIQAPALKNRMEDFEDLLNYFAREFHIAFSVEAIARLKEHKWPGNIRELKNVVARAKTYCNTRVTAKDVEELLDIFPDEIDFPHSIKSSLKSNHSSGNIIKDFERTLIEKGLLKNKGNQRQTAAELGIPKSTLHDRIKSYQIDLRAIKDENKFD